MAASVQKEIIEVLRKIQERAFPEAEALLKNLLNQSEISREKEAQALALSTFGVLEKVREDYKAAWRYYEKAEKLLPDDPSLKLIMSQLLIHEFSQYDAAIKKMKKVLTLAKGSASFEHQAHAMMAIAYLRKGDRKKAIEMLRESMRDDFAAISSAQNINLEVIEAFLARHFETESCRVYLEKALTLAKSKKENSEIRLFTKLLEGLSHAHETHVFH